MTTHTGTTCIGLCPCGKPCSLDLGPERSTGVGTHPHNCGSCVEHLDEHRKKLKVVNGGQHPETGQIFCEANFVWIRQEDGTIYRQMDVSPNADMRFLHRELEVILNSVCYPDDVIVHRLGIDIKGDYRAHWLKMQVEEGDQENVDSLYDMSRSILYDVARAYYAIEGKAGDPERDAYFAGWKEAVKFVSGVEIGKSDEVGIADTPEAGWLHYYNNGPQAKEAGVEKGQTWRHKGRGTVYRIEELPIMQIEDDEYDYKETVVYRDVESEKLWVRTLEEFTDGRFEKVEQVEP